VPIHPIENGMATAGLLLGERPKPASREHLKTSQS
jgi:hypothetical protein